MPFPAPANWKDSPHWCWLLLLGTTSHIWIQTSRMFLEMLFFWCCLEIQIKPTIWYCLQTSCGTEPNFWRAAFGPVSHGPKSFSDQPINPLLVPSLMLKPTFPIIIFTKDILHFVCSESLKTHQSIDLRPVGLFCLLEVSFRGLSTSQRSFGRISTQPGDLWCRGGFLEVKCFKSGCLGDVGKVLENDINNRFFRILVVKVVKGHKSNLWNEIYFDVTRNRCFLFGQNLRTKPGGAPRMFMWTTSWVTCVFPQRHCYNAKSCLANQLMEEFVRGFFCPLIFPIVRINVLIQRSCQNPIIQA